jgi:hypothetical protein
MTTELLSQIWLANQNAAQGPIRKLTPDNYRNRLTPETSSVGFIALHTAEVMHRFATMLFGREPGIQMQTVGGVSDEGNPLDLTSVQQMVSDSFAIIADQIRQVSDEQWTEIISSPSDAPQFIPCRSDCAG